VTATETEREVIDWINPAYTRDGEFLLYVSNCWLLNDSAAGVTE
jgi:hypothetical protein